MPADPLQPTFTLEISHECNGLLLAALLATPWSFSIRAVDRQFFHCSLFGVAQNSWSLFSFLFAIRCHSRGGWAKWGGGQIRPGQREKCIHCK